MQAAGRAATYTPTSVIFSPIIHRETGVQAECPKLWAAADPLKNSMQIEGVWSAVGIT